MRVPLLGGAYEAKSIIANAQRCINLYQEANQPDAPVPITHYLTPGLDILTTGIAKTVRATYRTSTGDLYTVIGPNVYYVSPTWTLTLLGTILANSTPVSFADNGIVIVLVDGTVNGYCIDMTTRDFGTIGSLVGAFYGADKVDILDTFFIFNRPGTNQFYISLSEATFATLTGGTAFDALDIAAKIGYPDPLSSLIVMHREIWLVGELTTEIWYNSGAADFTFQQMPGSFIEQGSIAKYSLAAQDLSVYWLSQDKQGHIIVLKGNSYQAIRISTNAIENTFLEYSTVTDAIGFTYQQEGHTYYVLTFPTADATWVWDESTRLWHQRTWTDNNGTLHRHRANCTANAYNTNVVGDWQNGNLYSWDLNMYVDNVDGEGDNEDGSYPISRIRSFAHLIENGNRVTYRSFQADMEVGEDTDPAVSPVVALRWSDDRGRTYSNKVEQSLGNTGRYLTNVSWNRLGMARDRVFELSWSSNAVTALNGAFIEKYPAAS